jgi:hypothetical protein
MDEKLYIPMGVKTESEIFPGFGRKQLLQSIVGSIGAGVVAIFIWIFSHNVTPAVICILTGIIGSVMMTTKGPDKSFGVGIMSKTCATIEKPKNHTLWR